MTRTTDLEQMRVLARLDASAYSEQFVLKGALSLFARYDQAACPTEDLDLAAWGLPNTPDGIGAVLREIAALPYGDGLLFDAAVRVSPINEALKCPGVSARLTARLESSRADLQIDVSFGNAITPAPVVWTFPPLLLDHGVPVPLYPLYPLETVLAEKFAALVEIGEATTRMKDLYDLHVILSRESFSAVTVIQALRRSFEARGTRQEVALVVLAQPFAQSETLTRRWQQYLNRTRFSALPFDAVMDQLNSFFEQVLTDQQWKV
ncbi:nucleotidyl transferase AbiEii/AbiGii toxin family protein [Deinococcus marmoris]|uniref:nucleotidyl transferase AbiEii/AbiGii toxin family protein n=1 Tax=Deinococcus marmoris TaxID=249408 RepID=UPI00068EF7E0|nr:nucleotidyl transferase AbiEii/AbiGii toxin family protein [Deinococcus marmoris]